MQETTFGLLFCAGLKEKPNRTQKVPHRHPNHYQHYDPSASLTAFTLNFVV